MAKAKPTRMRDRNLRRLEEPARDEAPQGAEPIYDDEEIVGYTVPIEENTDPDYFPNLDYGEGKTAEEEIAGQQVLVALLVITLLLTLVAGAILVVMLLAT